MDNKNISLNRSIKMWNNIPIDARQITPSLNELDENINYPYIGMVFYSEFEDDYYKVITLEDGYRIGRTGEIVRASQTDNPNPALMVPGYFVGSYEQLILRGNTDTMISSAYIDENGFLHLVYADNSDHNVGFIKGNTGFSPEITENSNNNSTTYRLDIKTKDNITHLTKTLTTSNLKGPKGEDGSEVELRVYNNKIQWKLKKDDEWIDLVSLNALLGDVYNEINNIKIRLNNL